MGFSFHQLLGELMYCYVTWRHDIGYTICCFIKFLLPAHLIFIIPTWKALPCIYVVPSTRVFVIIANLPPNTPASLLVILVIHHLHFMIRSLWCRPLPLVLILSVLSLLLMPMIFANAVLPQDMPSCLLVVPLLIVLRHNQLQPSVPHKLNFMLPFQLQKHAFSSVVYFTALIFHPLVPPISMKTMKPVLMLSIHVTLQSAQGTLKRPTSGSRTGKIKTSSEWSTLTAPLITLMTLQNPPVGF